MESVNNNFAGQLVKAAIESNAIKLNGPAGTVEHSKKAAEMDAAYLLELLTRLTQGKAGDQPR